MVERCPPGALDAHRVDGRPLEPDAGRRSASLTTARRRDGRHPCRGGRRPAVRDAQPRHAVPLRRLGARAALRRHAQWRSGFRQRTDVRRGDRQPARAAGLTAPDRPGDVDGCDARPSAAVSWRTARGRSSAAAIAPDDGRFCSSPSAHQRQPRSCSSPRVSSLWPRGTIALAPIVFGCLATRRRSRAPGGAAIEAGGPADAIALVGLLWRPLPMTISDRRAVASRRRSRACSTSSQAAVRGCRRRDTAAPASRANRPAGRGRSSCSSASTRSACRRIQGGSLTAPATRSCRRSMGCSHGIATNVVVPLHQRTAR